MATPTTLPSTFVAGNVLTAAQMNNLRGAFRVLQVVSTAKSDTFSASIASGANTAVTGLSVSITPSATSSQILVIAQVNANIGIAGSNIFLKLLRGATAVGVGAAAGSRQQVSFGVTQGANTDSVSSGSVMFLDSPATTSSTTYSLNISHNSGSTRTVYVNRESTDTDAATTGRSFSSITVMEISA